MFGSSKRTKAEPADSPASVAELPEGYDRPESDSFVPPDRRDDYRTVDVPRAELERAARMLERELIFAEAAADQEPKVEAWLQRLADAGDQVGYTLVRQRFYGGGRSRVEVIGSSAVQEKLEEHEFRPRHMPERGLFLPSERMLTADELAIAEHRARLAAATDAHKRRRQAEAIERQLTCPVCQTRADPKPRTIKVAGAAPVKVRSCSACESALMLELRRRAARATLPSGRSRAQVAADYLDELV